MGKHGGLRHHGHFSFELRQGIEIFLRLHNVPAFSRIAQQANCLGMIGIAKNHYFITFLSVRTHLPRYDANVRAGRVLEVHVERLQVLAALGGYAMRPHHHDAVLAILFFDLDFRFALVIAHFTNAFATEGIHHLIVMNQWAVGIGLATCLGFLSGKVNGSLHSPAEAGALGS